MFNRVLGWRTEHARDKTPGPVAAIMQACHLANLTFENGLQLCHLDENDALEVKTLPWLACDTQKFLHTIRESLRMEQMSVLACRRLDFQGAQSGIDRKATSELSKQLSGLERYRLRTILCGAIATNVRLAKMDPEVDSTCQCCSAATPESVEHIFAECPEYNAERYNDITEEEWHALPPCLKFQGIMPRPTNLLPERWRSEQGRIDLAVIVQHNLLDIWAKRCQRTGATTPQPRWERAASQRNVRPRTSAARDGGTTMAPAGSAATAGVFIQGRDLQTGEHWPKVLREV